MCAAIIGTRKEYKLVNKIEKLSKLLMHISHLSMSFFIGSPIWKGNTNGGEVGWTETTRSGELGGTNFRMIRGYMEI